MAIDRVPILGLVGIGIVKGGVEELEPGLRPGELGFVDQLIGDQRYDHEDTECAEQHQQLEEAVGESRVAAREQIAANLGMRDRSGGLGRFGGWAGFRLRHWLGDANLGHGSVHRGQATGGM